MKHFMIKHVFQDKPGYTVGIKGSANDDRIVDIVMMTQYASSILLAPGQHWARKAAGKVATVQYSEDFFEVVESPSG